MLSTGEDAATHCEIHMSCLDLSGPIPAARPNPPAIDTFREDRVVSQAILLPRMVEQTWLSVHGVQGGECSNHSVPTKIPYKIQSLSGDWVFYGRVVFLPSAFYSTFYPTGPVMVLER